jgi:hypothetical protein
LNPKAKKLSDLVQRAFWALRAERIEGFQLPMNSALGF